MADTVNEESFDINKWLNIIIKRRLILAIVFILAFSGAIYYDSIKNKSKKPFYVSSATVMMGPDSLVVQSGQGGVIKQTYSAASEVLLMQSDIVMKKAALILKSKFAYNEPDDILVNWIKGVQITPTKVNNNALVITATSDDPKKAFAIASSVIEGYKRQKKDEEKEFFKQTYQTFSDQLDAAKKSLQSAQQTLTDFIMSHKELMDLVNNYNLSPGSDESGVSQNIAVNDRYLKIKSDILSKEAYIKEIKELSRRNSTLALTVLSKTYPSMVDLELKTSLVAKEEELNRLLSINQEAHPAVIGARGELEAIKKKIDNEITGAINNIESEIAGLRIQEQELSSLISTDIHKKILEYNMLKKDIAIKNDIYTKLAEQLQQMDLGDKIKKYSEMRILVPPEVPKTYSIKKTYAKNIMTGFAAAIVACFLVIYAASYLDSSVKDIDQLESITDLPVLVSVPLYKKHKLQASQLQES